MTYLRDDPRRGEYRQVLNEEDEVVSVVKIVELADYMTIIPSGPGFDVQKRWRAIDVVDESEVWISPDLIGARLNEMEVVAWLAK